MDKGEAVVYLKEILTKLDLSPDSFVIMGPTKNDHLTSGHKICIKTVLDNLGRQQVNLIAKSHGLAISEEHGQVLIYMPINKIA